MDVYLRKFQTAGFKQSHILRLCVLILMIKAESGTFISEK